MIKAHCFLYRWLTFWIERAERKQQHEKRGRLIRLREML